MSVLERLSRYSVQGLHVLAFTVWHWRPAGFLERWWYSALLGRLKKLGSNDNEGQQHQQLDRCTHKQEVKAHRQSSTAFPLNIFFYIWATFGRGYPCEGVCLTVNPSCRFPQRSHISKDVSLSLFQIPLSWQSRLTTTSSIPLTTRIWELCHWLRTALSDVHPVN